MLPHNGEDFQASAAADEKPVAAGTEEAVSEQAEAGMTEQVSMFEVEAPSDERKPKTPGGGNSPTVDPDKDDDPDDPDDEPDDPDNDPDEDERRKNPANPSAEDVLPKQPMIGMDGKTEDGSMPYELLKKQLEFLK